MGSVVVRSELFARIEAMARARHMTVERQVEELLTDAVGRVAVQDDVRRRLDAVAALTLPDVVQTDSVVMLREDRDR